MICPILLRLALATGFIAHTGLAQPFAISQTNYHGWADSFALNNGEVEAVGVPTVGRVMQFRLVGEEGVFSNTEIYTSPNPLQYIELETLSSLVLLQAGDVIAHTNRYTLFRRTKPGVEEEAQALLNRP